MTDRESDLEEIRRKKLEELQARKTEAGGTDAGSTAEKAATRSPREPVHVEDTDGLEAFVGEHDVVLVDYYADWCGPCKQLEPVVASVAAETDAAVLKVDIDAHPGMAAAQNVRGVPTIVLFANGEPVERLVGFQNEGQLRSVIDRHATGGE